MEQKKEQPELIDEKVDLVLGKELSPLSRQVSPAVMRPNPENIMELVAAGMIPDMGMLEKLIEMKNAEEDRQSKKLFEVDYAQMQKELKPILRTKENKKYSSSYAPVDEMQRQYGPILSAHGFSYWWDDVNNENGSLECTFCISKHGYTKRNSVIMPPYEPDTAASSGKKIMNEMQAEGTRLSYGHRYSMKAGLGVTETDSDTDGNTMTFEDGLDYADEINAIRSCLNIEQLDITVGTLKQKFKNNKDKRGFTVVIHEANRRKEQL